MDYQELVDAIKALPTSQQTKLIIELTGFSLSESYTSARLNQLLNKQVGCPHCKSFSYYRYGKDKGSIRFKCKECKRTFTEYTGTWMAGIHKKELLNCYLEQVQQEKSLDKISKELGINKKTAFDWRHKLLSSLEKVEEPKFGGIVESDETFFLHSEKGSKNIRRKPRKRGGKASSRGISDDLVAVIATADRKGSADMRVATLGRNSKNDIVGAIGSKLEEQAILCADGHVSYKGFAKDRNLSLVVLRADLKEHVKKGIYHIQNVNSLHNRIKKWIDSSFWGVSTKYLQNYLNWFRIQEFFKKSTNPLAELVRCSVIDLSAKERFLNIPERYKSLIATQN